MNPIRSGKLRCFQKMNSTKLPKPSIATVSVIGFTSSRACTVFMLKWIICRACWRNRSACTRSSPNAWITRMPASASSNMLDWAMVTSSPAFVIVRIFLPKTRNGTTTNGTNTSATSVSSQSTQHNPTTRLKIVTGSRMRSPKPSAMQR